jgi:hypothetical protein
MVAIRRSLEGATMRRIPSLAIIATTIAFSAAALLPANAAEAKCVTHITARDHGTFVTSDLTPPLVLTKDKATGIATHLGRYTLRASEVINLATLEVSDGSFKITAANGDTIVGTYAGMAAATSDPLVITYHVTGPVTGGSGRFHGAHGRLTWDGVANLGTGELSDVATGWISR